MSIPDLYLLRLELPMDGVVSLARRRGLPVREVDEGYLVHCALGELFKDKAPRLFSLDARPTKNGGTKRGGLPVWAYSSASKEELLASADAFGDVELHDAFERASLKERKLPNDFPQQVGFAVRLCPVVRLARDVDIEVEDPDTGKKKTIQRSGKKSNRRSREVDAFEAACLASHLGGSGWLPSDRRGAVYLDWVARRMERIIGIELVEQRLQALRWVHLWRRDHCSKRKSHKLSRPDIVVAGRLNITDQSAFRDLLSHGIGRHRAFGFGMLMLRPAREI